MLERITLEVEQLIMTARGNFRGEIVVDKFPITVAVDREVVSPVHVRSSRN